MIFQRLSRTDPERVFVVVQNNAGATINADDVCQWELDSASVDGVKVRVPATSNLWAFAGISDAAIASADFGLIQVYGYRSTSRIFQTNTSIATGEALVPVAGAAYLQSIATTVASNTTVTLQPVMAVLAESVVNSAASATVTKKIFLRAL